MQVVEPVDPNTASGKSKELFSAIEQRLKRVSNMVRLMGNSPAVLEAYLRFNEAFDTVKMTPKLRGLIAATVSEINPFGFQLQWKQLFPNAQQAVVGKGNHFPMCDAPGLVATSIRKWHRERVGMDVGLKKNEKAVKTTQLRKKEK